MSYFIIFTLVVLVLAVVYSWKISKKINPDDILLLDTYDYPAMQHWYKNQTPFKSLESEKTIAKRYIQELHHLDINEKDIVVGIELKKKYKKICQKNNTTLPENVFDPEYKPIFFNIRSEIGFYGEIAIIKHPIIRGLVEKIKITKKDHNRLPEYMKNNEFDPTISSEIEFELYWIKNINPKDYTMLYQHTQNLLKERWGVIHKVFYEENVDGTTPKAFFTIKNSENNTFRSKEMNYDEISDIMKIKGIEKKTKCLFNLLCSNLEFNEFVRRLTVYKENLGLLY